MKLAVLSLALVTIASPAIADDELSQIAMKAWFDCVVERADSYLPAAPDRNRAVDFGFTMCSSQLRATMTIIGQDAEAEGLDPETIKPILEQTMRTKVREFYVNAR